MRPPPGVRFVTPVADREWVVTEISSTDGVNCPRTEGPGLEELECRDVAEALVVEEPLDEAGAALLSCAFALTLTRLAIVTQETKS